MMERETTSQPNISTSHKTGRRAFQLSLIGGIVDVIVALLALVGSHSNKQPLTLGELGVLFGLFVIGFSILLRQFPLHHKMWATLVITFSVLWIFGSAGGLFVGLVLGVLVGVLGFKSAALITSSFSTGIQENSMKAKITTMKSNRNYESEFQTPVIQQVPIVNEQAVGVSKPIYVVHDYVPALVATVLWLALSSFLWYGYLVGGYVEQSVLNEYILIAFLLLAAASCVLAIYGSTFRFYWDHLTIHKFGSLDCEIPFGEIEGVGALRYLDSSKTAVLAVLLQIKDITKRLRVRNVIDKKTRVRLYDWLIARMNDRGTARKLLEALLGGTHATRKPSLHRWS